MVAKFKPSRHELAGWHELTLGDELAGGIIVFTIQYQKSRAFIITEHPKHWNIHHYRPDTHLTREFKGRIFPDNLYTYAIVSKNDLDLQSLVLKLLRKMKL